MNLVIHLKSQKKMQGPEENTLSEKIRVAVKDCKSTLFVINLPHDVSEKFICDCDIKIHNEKIKQSKEHWEKIEKLRTANSEEFIKEHHTESGKFICKNPKLSATNQIETTAIPREEDLFILHKDKLANLKPVGIFYNEYMTAFGMKMSNDE